MTKVLLVKNIVFLVILPVQQDLATTTLPNSQFPNTTTTKVIYPINFLLITLATSFKITEDIDYNSVIKNLALEFLPKAHDLKIRVIIYHNLMN